MAVLQTPSVHEIFATVRIRKKSYAIRVVLTPFSTQFRYPLSRTELGQHLFRVFINSHCFKHHNYWPTTFSTRHETARRNSGSAARRPAALQPGEHQHCAQSQSGLAAPTTGAARRDARAAIFHARLDARAAQRSQRSIRLVRSPAGIARPAAIVGNRIEFIAHALTPTVRGSRGVRIRCRFVITSTSGCRHDERIGSVFNAARPRRQ